MGVISCFKLLWSATALCEMKWKKKRDQPKKERKHNFMAVEFQYSF